MSNSFSNSNNPARRAEELALRMLEHGLTDAEHAELMQCLQHDDAAREQFLEQAFLHSLLREQTGDSQPGSLASQLFGVRPEELSELNARLIEGRQPAALPAPTAPMPTDLTGSTDSPGLSGFFRASGFVLSAFLCVVGVATIIALWASSPSKPSSDGLELANAATSRVPPAESGPSDAVKSSPKLPFASASQDLLEVRSVRLDYGTTRLSLPKVGYVIIEGPAELDLLGPMRARLSSGRIKMRVTESTGKGFVVETPYGEITDQGTEFGIDLTEKGQAGLVVFEGAVDLRVAEASALDGARIERFVGGEGVVINRDGQLNRVSSIFTGNAPTFLRQNEVSAERAPVVVPEPPAPLILAIDDNLGTSQTKKFYAIVPGGLHEDARAYVDAIHEWNGVTSDGIPSYLIGADYIRTFNQYSIKNMLGICVTISRPAKLYVFLDARSTPPDWLVQDFRNTGDRIGLDAGPYRRKPKRDIRQGPGESIDEQFTIWERVVRDPGKIRLGSNLGPNELDPGPAMYGIAAVPLESSDPPAASDAAK